MPDHELLLKESVNAKLFQFKLKRMGITLSLWEVFCLFEVVNLRHAKMSFEPQRYHYIHFEHFYTLMTGLTTYKEDILYPNSSDKP